MDTLTDHKHSWILKIHNLYVHAPGGRQWRCEQQHRLIAECPLLYPPYCLSGGTDVRFDCRFPAVPAQHNHFDCGIFTIMYADCLARGVPLDFSQADIPQLRQFLAIYMMQVIIPSCSFDTCDASLLGIR